MTPLPSGFPLDCFPSTFVASHLLPKLLMCVLSHFCFLFYKRSLTSFVHFNGFNCYLYADDFQFHFQPRSLRNSKENIHLSILRDFICISLGTSFLICPKLNDYHSFKTGLPLLIPIRTAKQFP